MAPRKVSLHIRITAPDGSRPYCKPVYVRKGELKPGYALINGRAVKTGGSYQARCVNNRGKRIWHGLGDDPYVALDKFHEIESRLRNRARGVGAAKEEKPERLSIADAAKGYLERVQLKLSARTHSAYSRYLKRFSEHINGSIVYMDEITEDLLKSFEIFLYKKYPQENGKKPQTPHNVFQGVNTFLRERGIILRDEDGKSIAGKILTSIEYDEKIVDSYEPEELQKFFAVCTESEYLWSSYFLYSGCREQEIAHAEVCDLDRKSSTLHVQPKPSRRWKIKDKEDRFLPLPGWLVAKLLATKGGSDPHDLLFPNSEGNVEGHFLRKIQRIALRGGLNCGRCESTDEGEPVSCKDNACCSKWSCHAFRRTYATIQHEYLGVGVRTIQERLGHASLEVTQRYLKATNAKSKQAREQAESFGAMFSPQQFATSITQVQ